MDYKEKVSQKVEELVIADGKEVGELSDDELLCYFEDAEASVMEALYALADVMWKDKEMGGCL